MRSRSIAFLAVAFALCLAGSASAAELVLVETAFDAPSSTVLVRDVATGSERAAGTVPHAPGFGAAGAVSPDGRTLAVTVLESGNRPWRHASVWAVELESPAKPRKLLSEAVHTAPVWVGPKAFVAIRSTGEHEPSAEEARSGRLLDLDLEVVLVGVGGAPPKVLLADRCHGLEPFGVWSTGEIAVLRTARDGHALLGLSLDGRVRRVADLGPMTPAWPRLTPDRSAATFQQIAGFGSGQAVVSSVTSRGERRDLTRSSWLSPTPVPVAGFTAVSSGRQVALLDAEGKAARNLLEDPKAQRLVARAASADGKWLAVERVADGPARTLLIEVASGRQVETGDTAGHWRETMGLRRLP